MVTIVLRGRDVFRGVPVGMENGFLQLTEVSSRDIHYGFDMIFPAADIDVIEGEACLGGLPGIRVKI